MPCCRNGAAFGRAEIDPAAGFLMLGLLRRLVRRFPWLVELSCLVKNLVRSPGVGVSANQPVEWRRRGVNWPPGWYMLELKVDSALAGAAAQMTIRDKHQRELGHYALPVANGDLVKRLVYIPVECRWVALAFPEASVPFRVEQLRLAWGRPAFALARVARRLSGIHPDWSCWSALEVECVLRRLGRNWRSAALPAYEETFQRKTAGAGYARWREQHPDVMDSVAGKVLQELADRPRFSIVVPVHNPVPEHLEACLDSVFAQSYPDWQLCIADDASSDPVVRAILARYQARDSRVQVIFRPEKGRICAASNSALALATGDYVALLEHDDLLAPHALLHIARAVNERPEAAVVYTDEDKIDESGNFFDPHFKPDWNPELLLAQNYVSHLGVYRRELVASVGGFREGFEGAQGHDLLLRCVAQLDNPARQVIHIPRVLYHWRPATSSAVLAGADKSDAEDAALRAVNSYLAHQSDGAKAEKGQLPNTLRVRYPLPEPLPLVSLLVPTRNGVEILQPCVDAILERTDYRNYELLILDNQTDCSRTLAYMDEVCRRDDRVRVLKWDHPFNYSAINNFGAAHAKGSVLGLINNDIEPINPGWLAEMVSQAVRPSVGCVGAKLYYPDNKLQHGGVILGIGGVAGHSHKYAHRTAPGYFYRLMLAQNLSAVTGACLLLRRAVFEEVGGLNEEHLKVAFNDVDLCLKVREAGYQNLWTPYAEAYHHESVSRGKEDTPEKQARFAGEVAYMKQRWGQELANDPAYNPNLTLAFEDFSLR